MALEVSMKYANRIGDRLTGKNMLVNLATRISHRLKCDDRAVKIILLKLHVFATPGQHALPAGIGQEEWLDSMNTPTNLLGVKFSEGLREELKNVNSWMIMDEIDELPKIYQQNHI